MTAPEDYASVRYLVDDVQAAVKSSSPIPPATSSNCSNMSDSRAAMGGGHSWRSRQTPGPLAVEPGGHGGGALAAPRRRARMEGDQSALRSPAGCGSALALP